MQSSIGLSTCPKCQAIYHVLKVEAGPDAKDEGRRVVSAVPHFQLPNVCKVSLSSSTS